MTASSGTASRPGGRRIVWAAAVAAVVVAAGVYVATTHRPNHTLLAGSGTTSSRSTSSRSASSRSASSSSATATSAAPAPRPTSAAPRPATTVHVTALENDGQTYGVGMPIVLYFSPVPTDPKAFEQAVRVSVDGSPADGAWYWEQPTADDVKGHVVEAHYRMSTYWPADSTVRVDIPIGGRSAGKGLAYSSRLSSLEYRIGDAHVSTVNASGLRMQVTSNRRVVRTMPVSLGKAATPTFNGTKIVMQKGEDVPGTDRLRPNGTVLMSGPKYTDDPVQWSVRITRSGEYVHAAPWNGGIGARSTSNGCTNLHTADAEWFYGFSQVGDVVVYTGTDGRPMPSWDGLGDWNLSWSQWTQGGLLAP